MANLPKALDPWPIYKVIQAADLYYVCINMGPQRFIKELQRATRYQNQ